MLLRSPTGAHGRGYAPRPTPMSIFITERPVPRTRPVPAPTSREPGQSGCGAGEREGAAPGVATGGAVCRPLGAQPLSVRRASMPRQAPRATSAVPGRQRGSWPARSPGEEQVRPLGGRRSEAGTKSPSGEGVGSSAGRGSHLPALQGSL